MAANLSSMFAQLNNTVRQNPLVQRPDNTVPGMAERSVDRINPMLQGAMKGLTGAMGGDSAPLQTSKEAYQQGMQALQSVDLNTEEGLTQAAKVYQKLGLQPQALAMLEKASKKKQAKQTLLEQGGADITLEAQKKRAMAMAAEAGDLQALRAIKGGLIDPKVYAQAQIGMSKDAKVGTSSRTVRDSKGNLFTVVPITDAKTGVTKNSYAPIGDGPSRPQGQVTPISNTTGYSGADTQRDRIDLAKVKSGLNKSEAELDADLKKGNIDYQTYADIVQKKQERWDGEKADILNTYPDMLVEKQNIEGALQTLDTTSTSGIISSIESMKDYLGLGTTATHAQLNKAMSNYVLQNLKSLGANPTEGERKFLIDAAANIGRGTEANVALFESTLERLNQNIDAARYVLDHPDSTREDYVRNFQEIVTGQASVPTIDLSTMQ